MKISEEQAKKILDGTAKCKFSQLGFNMLISRLQLSYKIERSQDALTRCVGEMNNFISKYEAIMSHDLSLIAEL